MSRLFSFRIGPAPSMAPCFTAKRGMYGQGWIKGRAVGLCHTAKVDPHEGHLRPEPVSLPGARPAQGHYSGNAKRFLPSRSPQTAFPFL